LSSSAHPKGLNAIGGGRTGSSMKPEKERPFPSSYLD
jgi:hypothetical protein